MGKEIPLTQGYVAIVDDDDYDDLSQYRWHVIKTKAHVYAARHERGKGIKHRMILMHRQIMGEPDGMDVDHRDRNSLNNRKENLRICTRSQNMANMEKRAGKTATEKGVDWRPDKKKWRARIGRTFLGYFDTKTEAASAYDAAALARYGEFARTNGSQRGVPLATV
jgi:hypothetical protein